MILAYSVAGFATLTFIFVAWCFIHDLRQLRRRTRGPTFGAGTPATWSFLTRCSTRYQELINDIARSFTELSQSEELSRTRYDVLTSNVAASVTILEQNGTVMWCSPFTEVLTGFSTSEINKQGSEFYVTNVHEDDRDMVKRAFGIISLGEPFQFKYRFFHRSGTLLWLETRIVPIFDDGLDDFVALAMTFDVTASVNNQLYVEERNRDLQDFTYMITHDLKAPIFTIRGMLGILEEDLTPECPPSILDAITYITRATNRLETLVGGILELAKVSAAERNLTPISLHGVLGEVQQDYSKSLHDCGGTLLLPQEDLTVLGHATHLYQIFSNLVNNAIKYRSKERPLKIQIEVRPTKAARRVEICVTDNGRGIPEEKIPLLFKPFQRIGEETIEGTGVGLACVARLLEKSSGSIEAFSSQQPSPHTTFVVHLRRATGTQEAVQT